MRCGTGSVVGDWNGNRGGVARTERRGPSELQAKPGRREFLPGTGRLESHTSWARFQRLVGPRTWIAHGSQRPTAPLSGQPKRQLCIEGLRNRVATLVLNPEGWPGCKSPAAGNGAHMSTGEEDEARTIPVPADHAHQVLTAKNVQPITSGWTDGPTSS
jgi:hypothetical protein